MTAIKPGSGDMKWATIAEAEKLPKSKGVKKLRADVLGLSKMEGKEREIDLTNHFLVSVAEKKTYVSDKPLVKRGLFGNKVAMKVGKDETTGKDTYVILNINSLSKRLGISKKEIRDNEKVGLVDSLIALRLQTLSTQQTTVTKIVTNIQTSLKESKPLELKENEKKLLNEFVSTHFEDPVLRKGISTFSEKKFGTENDPQAKQFLNRLISKIWWNAPNLIKVEDHEKLALTKETLGNISWGNRVFKGAALKLPGNAGNEMRRVQFPSWDTKHRYSIAIGDYVYSARPTPRSSKEVPIVMVYDFEAGKGQWVLANVNSLKRLGFSRKEIRTMSKKDKLDDAIIARLNKIDQFNKAIKPGVGVDIKVVEKYAKEHPDKDVIKILKTALKEHAKIGKGLEKRTQREGAETSFSTAQYMQVYIPRWENALFKNLRKTGVIQEKT